MLQINDTFRFTKKCLGGEDYFVLSQLYLPLIGIDSLTLYITLNNMQVNETTVKHMLDSLSFSKVNSLIQAFNKLEGIGLIKEYVSKTKGVYFVCLSPINAKSFLTNEILKNYLITKIGETEFTNLYGYVFVEKIKGYEEKTKRFDEVFKTGQIGKEIPVTIASTHTEEDNIRIKNDKFDYTLFKMLFTDEEFSSNVLNDEEFEKQILKISYQYQLNEEEMKEAVMKAMTIDKDLKYVDIAKYAGYIYQNKNKEELVTFKTKEVETYDHNLDDEEHEFAEFCKNTPIEKVLAQVSGGKGSLADIRDYTKLAEVTGLSDGVINVLIYYLTNLKGGDILSFNYLEKVARNWIKAGIKTVEDAILWLRKNKEEPTPKTKVKTRATEPDWMKKNNSNENEEISSEEIEKSNELIKKVFG